jgi:hypothetical protein
MRPDLRTKGVASKTIFTPVLDWGPQTADSPDFPPMIRLQRSLTKTRNRVKNEPVIPEKSQRRNEILPILPPSTIEKQAGFRTMNRPFGRSAEIHKSIFAAALNLLWQRNC